MRTTVTLDEDLAARLKDQAHAKGFSFKRVVNDAIRRGLDDRHSATAPFEQSTFDLGKPLVDLTKAGRLADRLDEPSTRTFTGSAISNWTTSGLDELRRRPRPNRTFSRV